jgi:hypothetical protein
MPEVVTEILKESGFSSVTYRKLTYGIAVVYLAQKTSVSE